MKMIGKQSASASLLTCRNCHLVQIQLHYTIPHLPNFLAIFLSSLPHGMMHLYGNLRANHPVHPFIDIVITASLTLISIRLEMLIAISKLKLQSVMLYVTRLCEQAHHVGRSFAGLGQ